MNGRETYEKERYDNYTFIRQKTWYHGTSVVIESHGTVSCHWDILGTNPCICTGDTGIHFVRTNKIFSKAS